MSSLTNYVYERTVDYIRNSARQNGLRDEYDRYMGAQNYNNNEMQKLVDVIVILAEDALRGSRTEAEDRAIIADTIEAVVIANVAAFAMSDRRISDALPDDIFRDVQRAESDWRRACEKAVAISRGGSARPAGYQSSQARSALFGNVQRDNTSVFGSRSNSLFDRQEQAAPARSSSIWDTPNTRATQQQAAAPTGQSDWPARSREEPARQAPVQQPAEEVRQNGPDMSKERPYDDFWLDGEHWQLAHKSNWQWSFSPKQQTRRTYDPDNEVCFLVKDKTGHVREEFLPVVDDLEEASHEIRVSNRPNSRLVSEREEGDAFVVGNDIDAVDLDVLANTAAYVRKQHIAELEVDKPAIIDTPQTISTVREAAVRVAGEAVRNEADVVAVNNYIPVPMVADAKTLTALETITAISGSDSDLAILAKRLRSLRGVMAENVMDFIDEHFTNEVNAALRDQFGLTVSIDSFVSDFDDLLECGTFKRLGSGAVAQFLSRTRALLATLQYVNDADSREELVDAMDILPRAEDSTEQAAQAFEDFRKTVAIMFKPMSVLHVKIDSDKFGMVGKEVRTPPRQGQHADVPLATALTSLYHIGRKTSGAGHVYVVTADNIMFELVPISGARDVVGIRLA